MPKNIIICSDGTGNTAVKGRGTNVFKLFEAVDLNGHRTDKHLTPQVAIYDDGVGTEEFKPLKIFAGATGFGLANNVRRLYKSLVRVYDPGDQIFLFGFSRGAFTVRTLGGLITRCGILDMKRLQTAQALDDAVSATYKTYRKAYRTELAKLFLGPPELAAITKFREENCLPGDISIRFIGVWDTVDAVGTPLQIGDIINAVFHRFKFPDLHLSKSVIRACHALSLDDPRMSFTPVLWDESQEEPTSARISQVWFAGVHSNVGGGYPKQGLSLVAMDWMMWHARKEGLRIVAEDARTYYDHANVDDKLYNPRSGMGMFYRWALRDVTKLCTAAKVRPALHLSALERVAHGTEDYAPGNLPPYGEVIFTPTGDPERDKFAKARADHIKQVLRTAHDHESVGQPLLSECRMEVTLGHLSYWMYVLSFVPMLALLVYAFTHASWQYFDAFRLGLRGQGLAAWLLVARDDFLDNVTVPVIVLVGGLFCALALSRWVKGRMSKKFSAFWHGAQPLMRKRLNDLRNSPQL
jgi:uncharacterized protein (DUF2235 family)